MESQDGFLVKKSFSRLKREAKIFNKLAFLLVKVVLSSNQFLNQKLNYYNRTNMKFISVSRISKHYKIKSGYANSNMRMKYLPSGERERIFNLNLDLDLKFHGNLFTTLSENSKISFTLITAST